MGETRFTEERMATISREPQSKTLATSISVQTYYAWKKKFGGREATDVKRMRELEDENSRLKRILANLTLENEAINQVLKKVVSLPQKREAAARLVSNGFML